MTAAWCMELRLGLCVAAAGLLAGCSGSGSSGDNGGNSGSGSSSSGAASSSSAGSTGGSSMGGSGSSTTTGSSAASSTGGGSGSSAASGSSGGSSSSASGPTCTPDGPGGATSSSGGACAGDDLYEPNNAAGSAAVLNLSGETTSIPALLSCGTDDDFYRVTVPAGAGIEVTLAFTNDTSDLDLYLLNADGLSMDSSTSSTQDTEVVYGAFFEAPTDVIIRVRNYGQTDNTYTLTVRMPPGGVCIPDSYEEDDVEADATNFTGLVTNRTACAADADFYSFTVPEPSANTRIRVEHDGAATDLTLKITQAGQSTALGTRVMGAAADIISFPSTAGTTYVLEVGYAGAGVGSGYGLMGLTDGLCRDDSYDTSGNGNDTAADARVLTNDSSSRYACPLDPDYYAADSRAVDTAEYLVLYDQEQGDLNAIAFATGAEGSPLGTAGAYDPVLGGKKVSFPATLGTRYFLRVENPVVEQRITYGVTLSGGALCVDDSREPNDSISTPTQLNTSLSSLVACRTDADYYFFSVGRSGPDAQVLVTLALGEVALTLVSGSAVPVANTQTRDGDVITMTFAATGGTPYILRVSNAAGVSHSKYRLQVRTPQIPGETCDNPLPLMAGQTVGGDTTAMADNVTFTSTDCTGNTGDGYDLVYSVEVPAGQTLTATLASAADLGLWLLEDCSNRCCWAGADAQAGGANEVLTWTNPTTVLRALLLGVEGRDNASAGPFTLGLDIQ